MWKSLVSGLSVTSGTTGNKCAEINKHRIGKPGFQFGSSLGVGYYRPIPVRTRYTQLKRQIQTLMSCFETIQIESSNVTPVKDEAFCKAPNKIVKS